MVQRTVLHVLTHSTPLPPPSSEPSAYQATHDTAHPYRLTRRVVLATTVRSLVSDLRILIHPELSFDESDPDATPLVPDPRPALIKTLYLDPVLLAANKCRTPTTAPLDVERIEPTIAADAIFQFTQGPDPFGGLHSPVKEPLLPVLVFLRPGHLPIDLWTGDTIPSPCSSFVQDMVQFAEAQDGRDVLLTDSRSAVLLRRVSEDNMQGFAYDPVLDLDDLPLRLIIASLVSSACPSYFPFPYLNEFYSTPLPSGALNDPSLPVESAEKVAEFTSLSDFDLHRAAFDSKYRRLFKNWFSDTRRKFEGRSVAEVGAVLTLDIDAFRRQTPALKPLYDDPLVLPDTTKAFLTERRRQPPKAAVLDFIRGSDQISIEVLALLPRHNPRHGSVISCRLERDKYKEVFTTFHLKIFDDRRMSSCEKNDDDQDSDKEDGATGGPGDPSRSTRAWWANEIYPNAAHVMVQREDAAYRRMVEAQGSLLPYYYGAHLVTLPDGAICWATLTEAVNGQSVKDASNDLLEPDVAEIMRSMREFVRVMQHCDITRGCWGYSDILITETGPRSSDAEPRRRCVVRDLSRTILTDCDGRMRSRDDHGELRQLFAYVFGRQATNNFFSSIDFSDHYAEDLETYTGPGWLPHDACGDEFTAEQLDWEEDGVRYTEPGGYHPTRIGDVFGGRYKVVRKLGWGLYATVWLAYDEMLGTCVALKILVAEKTTNLDETNIMAKLSEIGSWSPYIVKSLDAFGHWGPNGRHDCLTFELLGLDVGEYCSSRSHRSIAGARLKLMAGDILKALEWLHSHGIAHTDLKAQNLAFSFPRPPSDRELIALRLPAQPPSWTRLLSYIPIKSTPSLIPPSPTDTLKVIDFGSAQYISRRPQLYPVQPEALRAPEVILEAEWDEKVDIWNFACLIYELYSGQVLFSAPKDFPDQTSFRLAKMESLCGPFPGGLLERGHDTAKYFSADSGLVSQVKMPSFRLKDIASPWLRGLHDASDEEIDGFTEFLTSMLVLDPAARPSASQMLSHRWLQPTPAPQL